MKKLIIAGLTALSLALIGSAAYAQSLPVFPGALGYGTDTVAGRGGQIYKVTNLNNSGAGSLRQCVNASGPRVCVFETSGVINLTSNLNVDNRFITIAGQTAPEPGITLADRGLIITSDDVLIKHIRVRRGSFSDGDGIAITGPLARVVVDHVSVSYAGDGSLDLFGNTSNVTMSNMIIDGTQYRNYENGGQQTAWIMGNNGANQVSAIRNVVGNTWLRGPIIQPKSTRLEVINNVQYNIDQYGAIRPAGDGSNPNGDITLAAIGNVTIAGPDNAGERVYTVQSKSDVVGDSEIYMDDNICPESRCYDGPQRLITDENPNRDITQFGKIIFPAINVEEYVLANAGAYPAFRDAMDVAFIKGIRDRTGELNPGVNHPAYATAINTRTLNIPSDPNGDINGDGYTNLENWLHGWSKVVEGEPTPPPVNEVPTISISVLPNIEVEENTAFTFTANAQDAEDGDISNKVEWSTGDTGNTSIMFYDVGTHNVTATVADSEGASISAGVVVTVVPEVINPPDPGTHTHDDLVAANDAQDLLLEDLFNQITQLATNMVVLDQKVQGSNALVSILEERVSLHGDMLADLYETLQAVVGNIDQNRTDLESLNVITTAQALAFGELRTNVEALELRIKALEDTPPGTSIPDPHEIIQECIAGVCRNYWVDPGDGDDTVVDPSELESRVQTNEEDIGNLQNGAITNSASIRDIAGKL